MDIFDLTELDMVFQKPNPFPKSIYENVAYGPGNGYRGNLDEIVEESLRRAAIWDEVKDKFKHPAWPCPAASSSVCASPAPSRPTPRSS